jgi:hypothetical protein
MIGSLASRPMKRLMNRAPRPSKSTVSVLVVPVKVASRSWAEVRATPSHVVDQTNRLSGSISSTVRCLGALRRLLDPHPRADRERRWVVELHGGHGGCVVAECLHVEGGSPHVAGRRVVVDAVLDGHGCSVPSMLVVGRAAPLTLRRIEYSDRVAVTKSRFRFGPPNVRLLAGSGRWIRPRRVPSVA